MPDPGCRRLLLLDREGTVLRPPRGRYVLGWEDVQLQDHAIETIVTASRAGFVPVLVTNQSCVNQGLASMTFVDEVNGWLATQVQAAGGPLMPARVCPHVDADACLCRKPLPGMIHDAARLTGLPVATAWYVGDSIVDQQAAGAAGVARFLHVCPDGDRQVCDRPAVTCLPRFRDLAELV